MLIEMRTYMLRPGGAPQWLQIYEDEAKDVQIEILGNLLGYFSTEIGPLNQIIHMWGYESYEDRLERRTRLFQNQRWLNALEKLRPLVVSQEAKLIVGAPFSPIK